MKSFLTASLLAGAALELIYLTNINDCAQSAEPASAPPSRCAKCGCHDGLVPVCHTYCTTKIETKYRYYCKCETICVPDGNCSLTKCGSGPCENSNGANHSCSNTECNCSECQCHCLVKDVYKLVKVPYTAETPVRKCTVEWICPECGCTCSCTETSESIAASLLNRR
jgi:hypothetical protein